MQLSLFPQVETKTGVSEVSIPPLSLDILGKRFTVIIIPTDNYEDYPDCDGLMELEKLQISIRLHTKDYNQDTLLHEVIHAVDQVLHLRMKESQVHLMATGLMTVLKNNPAFTRWLTA